MRLSSLLPSACLSLLLALVLVACAAPSASPEALGPAVPGQAPPPGAAADPAPPASAPEQGSPPALSRGPAVPGAAMLDYSCGSDSDCAVKNVGNCCGYYPACVNKDSPTDPAAVRAQCQQEGRAGVCGFPTINSCQCVQGRCEGSNQMLPAL